MKSVAAGLLLTAALVWLLCVLLGHGGWVGYVQATAEAAMVGALADWFAVTALFRHPLGLPIPHTAILPRKKDALGASLGEFVQTNFLSAEVISDKLSSVRPGYKLGVWLADPTHAGRIGDAAGAAIGGITEVMRDDDVQSGLEQVLVSRLRDAPKAPFAGRMVDIAIEAGHDQRVLVAGVAVLRKFLDENRQVLRDRFAQESPKWVPNKVDDRVFARAYTGLQHFLDEVAEDPEHPLRKDASVKVRAFAQQLRTDPEMELKVTKLGETLRDDPALQAKFEVWFDEAVRYMAHTYRSDIADLVAGTVARWDAEETSRRIELQVGRDLQFIRVNGTVVGGLAGLVIYTISQLIT